MVAVIIAGGKGTRLAQYTKEIPKPMIPLLNKPVLEYQIAQFKRYGIVNVIMTVGYLKEAIKAYFGDGSRFGIHIRYIEEKQPLGSAGALYYIKEMVSDDFFVVYGDVLFDISLERMMKYHKTLGGEITVAVHPNSHPYDSDLVICDDKNKVQEFNRKNSDRTGMYYKNCVNAGFFLLRKSTLDYFEEVKKSDFEKDFLMSFIAKGQAIAYPTSEYIKDMGTYDRLAQVEQNIKSGIVKERNLDSLQKCIFLDRDGTINVLKGFLDKAEEMELEIGSAEAIKRINDSGYLAVVITNQPVIARGMCSLEELEQIHKKMETILGQKGAYLDGIYYCPHHPDRGYEGERKEYKIKCKCRKPNIGMVIQAAEEFNIDLSKSWFVGDSTVDIQTGKNARMRTALLRTGEGGRDGKYNVNADIVCVDLLEAVKTILDTD